MKASFDATHDIHDEYYDKYKDYDFADAKPVAETPVLERLQAGEKSRIALQVDNDVLAFFRAQAEHRHDNYQTLINEALRQFMRDARFSGAA
uniref:BrnA antitoxin of type II toxin-antitoxin system n=1 Tax=Candidatus Kentrum sp. MB TaxID=2138164 RepID=A0A451BBH9_9GAMM|nr:MAG: BrnA antitoxin of type II toxin-antitoxin system [Candidatus Kentron sp. MB]VFK31701.1 MAG: BrnA antitoxin of type II toxin-antitoxin system [Candidatus Kentron sp. MB]VFK75619.1 MAG: BrnA antitoxin of type II toxin-antitoxin system [Candidatus Kentron sp. MB]